MNSADDNGVEESGGNIFVRFYNNLLFSMMYPLIKLGNSKGSIELQDIVRLPSSWRFKTTSESFEQFFFSKVGGRSAPSSALFFLKHYWTRMVLCLILRVLAISLDMFQLWCLNSVLTYSETTLSNNSLTIESVLYVVGLCMLMFIAKTMKSLVSTHNLFQAQQIGEFTKASFSNAIYKKTLKMGTSAKHEYSTGTIMNIATTDASRFPWFYYHIDVILASILSMLGALGFSIVLLGTSALVGFSVILVVVPFSIFFMAWEQKMEEIIEAFQDERSQIISQMVSAMRFVKFYTLEQLFKHKIMDIREKEMKAIKKGYISDSGINTLWHSFLPFISFFAFLHYCYVRGETLSVSTSFSFLSVLNMIKYDVIFLPNSLLEVSRAFTSFKRIIKLLNAEEISLPQGQTIHDQDTIVEYNNASFTWDSLSTDDKQPVLKDISLKLGRGEFICIIGKIGQGKSSLLSSMLGEVNFIENQGSLFEKQQGLKYSYVSQDSWIRNQTIRENILFGEEFELQRYKQVLHACNLVPDLQQISKEVGDLTMIGESGINLSGGQKLRVSLARCFYSDSDVYLLDDPLSAVDVHTADHILKHGILGLLAGKTTIMVTNQIHFIDKAHRIIVMDDGKIVQDGTYPELYQDEDKHFRKLIDEFSKKSMEQQGEKDLFDASNENDNADVELLPNDPQTLQQHSTIEEEIRTASSVGESFKRLINFAVGFSKVAFPSICLITILQQVIDIIHQYILTLWSTDEKYLNYSLLVYMFSYLGTSLLFILADVVAGFIGLSHYLNTAKMLHEKLMTSIIQSCIAFFDATPMGRIVARFTRDTNAIDGQFNHNLVELTPNVAFWIGGIIMVMILSPYSIISILILSPFVFIMQKYYRFCLRGLESLSGVCSSPVNSQISETIHGLQTIRAFGKEEFLIDTFVKKAETEVKVSYNIHCIHKYFDIRGELLSALCIALIIITSVLSFSGSLVGMIILQATSSFESFYYISYLFVMLEKDLVSVERIEQYSNLESEKYQPDELADISSFGTAGNIELKNVQMKYKKYTCGDSNTKEESNKLILKGINLSIKEKERIAICGRTGCGKSSLIQCLFRMQEVEKDSYILIDNTDIRNVPLEVLRSVMCIIPQQPTLFKGTLRENLDSYSQFTDREIWDALGKVGMKDKLEQLQTDDNDSDDDASTSKVVDVARPTGLEMRISENGENISAGTRQLLCLARALIRKSNILILDEATSNCDLETDQLIQKALREEFSSKCTVICVAHRLETIMDYTKVVVIDDGVVREFGTPHELLENPNSLFSAMVEKHKKRGMYD